MKWLLWFQMLFTAMAALMLLIMIVDAIWKASSLYYIVCLIFVFLFLYLFIKQLIKELRD